jgi:hypothetical protein
MDGRLTIHLNLHIALRANDQFRTLHGTISPDFWVVSVVTDDHAHLHALWTFDYARSEISRGPPFDWRPWKEFSVLLDDFPFIVDQNACIVGILLRMLFVLFSSQRKDPPSSCFLASGTEHIRQRTRDSTGSIKHFLSVVHDALTVSPHEVKWTDMRTKRRTSRIKF